ncbi:hypothetical protein LEMLEM_LOCUS26714 [Lemmus lemmus]
MPRVAAREALSPTLWRAGLGKTQLTSIAFNL